MVEFALNAASHQSHLHPSQTNGQQPQDGASVYHATYHAAHDYNYPAQNTGAVPRTSWHNQDLNKITQRPYSLDDQQQQPQSIQTESGKESPQKETQKNSKSVTKTYHTIKDMISSRFKSGNAKDNAEDKPGEDPGLNNVNEELRKSVRSVDRLGGEDQDAGMLKKTAGEQGIYGKPRVDGYRQENSSLHLQQQQQQQQYNQHLMQQQQQMLQQYHVQQYTVNSRQQQQQLTQARSQEILHAGYTSTPQRPPNRYGIQQTPDQNYVVMHHPQFGEIKVNAREVINERCVDDRRPQMIEQQRSAQQLERDNIRQKSFEARRTASQPQLAYDDKLPDNIAQPQMNQNTHKRVGSQGNLVETHKATIEQIPDTEKDSDDGGFLKRTGSQNRLLETVASVSEASNKAHEAQNGNSHEDSKQDTYGSKDDAKLAECLSGSPRKRLEGEIGKIEGVYNVGPRYNGISDTDKRILHRKQNAESGASSDYDKPGQSSSNADSGRGSAAYSSGRRPGLSNADTSNESSDPNQLPSAIYRDSAHSSVHDPEWVDIVENELRHILEPKLHELSLQNGIGVANSTLSESISSMTPPLPPLSPGEQSSPNVTPRNSTRYKHSSLPYGSKPEYGHDSYNKPLKGHSGAVGPGVGGNRWHSSSTQKHRSGKKIDHSSAMRGKQIFGLDTTDIASTTTRSLDLESILDGQSDSDGDISTADARTIRKQLEGLESMYSEVLKLLGVKKYSGRYQPSDPRFSKRRYGSMSSLPSSSVSSRPIRDKRRAHEDRKKVKDIRGINKRFQRLESHVVTLARSVAHLSSEMRTQHLMIQEMENIRGEISALRTQTNMLNVRSQSTNRGLNISKDLPDLANPTRVKKLTKFFGDEPPLLRLFLKKLGYEKYANAFENERVGMVELPYLSEERLQKMGVPLGPRLRILQEAQISVCNDNTLCIV